jgi:anti-sigma factor RsiW
VNSEHPIREEDLQAYVDDALSSEERTQVEAYLVHHPAEASRLAGYARQRDGLRELFGPIAGDPLPERLDVRRLTGRPTQTVSCRWSVVAAAVVLFALGGASGYALRATTRPAQTGVRALAREAADSFRVHASDPMRPVEIDATRKAELVRWFSERLQNNVSIPDLAAAGYQLLGGRLVTTAHGPAALILYTDASGRKLAVFVRPMAVEKNTRMSEQVDGVLGSVAWADHGIGYSLVGPLEPQRLHPLADEVRRQARAG